MAGIDIKVTWSNDIGKKLLTASNKVVEHIDKGLLAYSIFIEGEVKKLISRGKRSGIVYTRGGRRAQRSGGTEPPKTDTGRLVGSIRYERNGSLNYSVGTDVYYAVYLEKGTRYMHHPFLQPTLEKNESKLEAMVLKALQGAIS